MPKFYQGSGPLGRDVAYNELSTAAQKSTPQIIASGQGNTSIVGNGAAQTVFTDTLSITPASGDTVIVHMKETFSRTAGAGVITAYTPMLGATNLLSQGATDGNVRVQHNTSVAGSGGRGYFITKEIQDGATGTAGETVITNTSSYGAAPTTVSLTLTVPAASTYNVEYSYCVILYKTGV